MSCFFVEIGVAGLQLLLALFCVLCFLLTVKAVHSPVLVFICFFYTVLAEKEPYCVDSWTVLF